MSRSAASMAVGASKAIALSVWTRGRGSASIMWYGGRLSTIFFAAALFFGYATAAHAAPGNLDTTFDGDGKVVNDLTDFSSDSGLDVAVQEDGKIVVAGNAFNGASGFDFAVVRYNPDGSPDASFGTGGRVMMPVGAGSSNDDAYAVAVRPDGKIVAAGFTNNEYTNIDFAAVRLNADGSLDTTFDDDGKVITPVGGGADFAVDVAVQGNKTILAGRSFNTSHNDFALVRYDDSGALDTSFDADGKATLDFSSGSDDYGEDIVVEPGGKIVVAGSTGTINDPSTNNFAVARFNADGSPDPGFSGDGKAMVHFGTGSDNAYAVAIQEDGKIVVGGRAQGPSGDDFALARFRANGTGDGEFDLDGKLTTDLGSAGDWLWDLAVQDDGRIVVAGTSGNSSSHANFALARYNPDGSLNTSFDHDGRTQTDFASSSDEGRSVALQEDGRIVVAGLSNSVGNNDFALARYFGGNDVTPPRANAPVQSLPAPGALGAASAPVKLSWSATDLHGDVTGYGLQKSTDGGPYEPISLSSVAATTTTLPLAPGHTYRFRARATDDNGNTSNWEYGPRFALDTVQENGAGVSYPAGTWQTHNLRSASGGTLSFATAKGATSRLSFTGSSVAWVAPKSATRGRATVYLDGVKVATVDLFSSKTLARRVMFAANSLDPTVGHTLTVRSLGTAGRPRVDVDAFVVLR